MTAIFLLIISAFTRLYRLPEYFEFLGDQGRDLVIIRDFLVNHNLFFIGPQTSIGNMYLGPFFYYLIAPSLWLARLSPLGPSIFVSLLGVATTYLIYRFTKKDLGYFPALISALLFAASPQIIKYTSFSWNPNVAPFFSLLCLQFVYLYHQNKSVKFLYLSVAMFCLALNTHYLTIILSVPILLFALPRLIRQRQFFPLFISLAIFVLFQIPLILFDIKHQGQNFQAFFTFFTQRQTTVNLKVYKSIYQLPKVSTIFSQRIFAGKDLILGTVSLIYMLAGLAVYFFRRRFSSYFLLHLVTFFVGLVSLALYKQHIYDHYYGFMLPSAVIVFGYILVFLFRLSPITKVTSVLLLLLIAYSYLVNNHLRFPAPRHLQITTGITDQIIKSADGQPFNFALLSKSNYDPPYTYLFLVNHAPYYHLRELHTQQLFVVCEPHPDINCQPINHPSWDIAAFGWAQITDQWTDNGRLIYRLTPNPTGQ